MTIRAASMGFLCAGILLCSLNRAAEAQIDLRAVRAYLRTGMNAGSEVATPARGQEVFLHIDYAVAGGSAPVTATVRALIDGTEHCSGAIEFEPNTADQSIWCPQPYVASAGTHTLRWELDTQGQVVESNESNNAVALTFTTAATGSRDLEALRAYLRTGAGMGDEVVTPALDQAVYLHIEYRVGGTGAAFMAVVEARLDGEVSCTGPILVTPGVDGIIWCPTPWPATAGTHTLSWQVDPENAISETDEDNNTARVIFTTGGTTTLDIEAERAYLRTDINAGDEITEPAGGQEVYFHVDYTVAGASAAFSADVRALIDGQEHCAGPVDFDPGPATVWCGGAWTATAGTHTLRWILDSTEQVNEADEGNNSTVTTFAVGGGTTCTGDCDENGAVVVSELVTGVNIALDRADIEECPAFDVNGSGTVQINELVSGVDNLLRGCE